MRFLVFIGAIGIGFVLIKWAKWIRDNSGIRFGFAESFLGGGGTIDFIKIFGVLMILGAFWALFNLNI